MYLATYNNFLKIRVYGSTANNAVSLARPILLNERFLVIIFKKSEFMAAQRARPILLNERFLVIRSQAPPSFRVIASGASYLVCSMPALSIYIIIYNYI